MKKRIKKHLLGLHGVLIKTVQVHAGFWKVPKETCQEFVTTTFKPEYLDAKSCFRAIRSYQKARSLDIPVGQTKALKQCLAGN
ncbi:hypothetical protein [Christiangramia crocea]|uniref:Uncharacterized protein n=1 Tax=Christiangramia crocea TaxID=2904124 RepID=A0A9X2A5R7_9FLAO|nr:hypothetical protein [Gramella crocea]MCG9970351.1 hypothetical protein [Gramella crocea]